MEGDIGLLVYMVCVEWEKQFLAELFTVNSCEMKASEEPASLKTIERLGGQQMALNVCNSNLSMMFLDISKLFRFTMLTKELRGVYLI